MAQRLLSIPPIGEVVLAKRRGSTRMRLSISTTGKVRVGMPQWTPYEAGIMFVKSQEAWIMEQLSVHAPKQLANGSRIGKHHRLIIYPVSSAKMILSTRVTNNAIVIRTNLPLENRSVQDRLAAACERALKHEAEAMLPKRLELISRQNQLGYRKLRIRKLTSRWGSCSSLNDISLSYFLIQLPWELIDYVILHELAHTVYHSHGREFWDYMETLQPNIRTLRRMIKQHKPRVEPY